ncbi:hypothetical protein BU24DRAFT_441757 [Aaosphaeria arxii CBS 175.79]|uniref:DUF917-domain-containing protein n=1 Tax=Aaosphaeria arxii CBS 175.79 TaxID=1450172 RepID=A0A6A5XLR5_9PLEO|nr:uncharacterized protein BU24DRAFT_441757 [Aaosphaeria arxii CBS 175.79]KAF2014102.1 hypothetical protein BU24DRAFT_441757 [Aaosphaeria arxii CBS 175.79]
MAVLKSLRLGVDVGGTNTDGVIIDPTREGEENRGILAWHKEPTTTDPSFGIARAITAMFEAAGTNPSSIGSVTIGTTHFVNAVVTRDASRLCKVAVIRLCGPFTKHSPPCIGWPKSLRNIVLGHSARLKGGLEVDGSLISDIDEEEILEQAHVIKERGIGVVVVNGVFSPIDTVELQEERAAAIIRREIPGVDVVLSKHVSNLGFLERENAAILNASILKFARQTIASFQLAIAAIGLTCPIFITQNDGTVLTCDSAARLPIRTFSSGPTNSMRGAAFLVGRGEYKGKSLMVVDIGGTTSDVGLLLPNGFPRQKSAYSELSGVRMNFNYPDVKSIGLGGGSLVRKIDGRLTVGPESVGYKLSEKALVFNGDTATATDYTVAGSGDISIGDVEKVRGILVQQDVKDYQKEIKRMIEAVIDSMKTSPEDIPVLLVGGGAVIAPDALKGASCVIKPQWSGVANAIGAAMARVSTVIDTVKSTENLSTKELVANISEEVKQKTIKAGATEASIEIVEIETFPLAYIDHKTRFIIRAAGDFDFSRLGDLTEVDGTVDTTTIEDIAAPADVKIGAPLTPQDDEEEELKAPEVDYSTYKPKVQDRLWYLSETDLHWIATGCYILGTGGGGSPYPAMLAVRAIMRFGGTITIKNPVDLKDDDQVGSGVGVGSPTVAMERMAADELLESQTELYKYYQGDRPTAMIATEIGGVNGMMGFILGSSPVMNVPVIDGDWMGRAYPVAWQSMLNVCNERPLKPSAVACCDGNGNNIYIPAVSSLQKLEKVVRATLGQLGSNMMAANAPYTGAQTKSWVIEHTLSQAWRIGRAVARARKENRVDTVAESIIDAVGGPGAGRVLFKGKVVGVERTLIDGHIYGEVIIEGTATDERYSALPLEFTGRVKVPFKNENIAVIKLHEGQRNIPGKENNEDVLAIAPDLISIIDAQNGEAIGSPEYRYGLLVIVLGIAASDKWTSTQRAIDIGGPKGFSMDHLEYRPLGKFVKPVSVIDEYNS